MVTSSVMGGCVCQLKSIFHKKRVIRGPDCKIAVAKDRQQVYG